MGPQGRPQADQAPGFLPEITAAGRLQESHLRLASGAFHDALFMNGTCPTGMIFVPCERGISHNPAENADPDDLAAGARVLLASLVALAN
jgi:N-carbamoyl-L-amino-acid hydrolase